MQQIKENLFPPWFWPIIMPIIALWAVLPLVGIAFLGWPENVGILGDAFGIANSLFTALAFAFLIVTIWQQKRELSFQREELGLQRIELARSSDELEGQKEQLRLQNETLQTQSATMERQAFENTFFELLRRRTGIIDTLKKVEAGRTITGNNALVRCSEEVNHDMNENSLFGKKNPELKSRYALKKSREDTNFDRYYSNFEALLDFMNTNCPVDTRIYLNILLSELTDHDLTLLLYYCSSDFSTNNMQMLVGKYNIFGYMHVAKIKSTEYRKYLARFQDLETSDEREQFFQTERPY